MGIFGLSPENYVTVYLLIVTFFTIVAISTLSFSRTASRSDLMMSIVLCCILIFFLGTRPIHPYFADMGLYYGIYLNWSEDWFFDFSAQNLVFDNLETFLASIGFDPTLHYILFAAIYFGSILVACRKMFPQHIFISYVCYLAAFSTFSYCVNGYKAGSAAALFLIALAYRDNIKVSIPFVLLSWGFHHSMQLPVVAFIITQIYNKPKYYYFLWIVCAIISICHITWFQSFFANLTDEHGADYLLNSSANQGFSEAYKSGFRFDFWLYSAMPVVMGWYITTKFRLKSKSYDKLLCMYLLVNSIWLLCIYASFTNRIAYLSWFMYPIVLIYPLFNEQLGNKRRKYVVNTVLLHLSFTLFMDLIYY